MDCEKIFHLLKIIFEVIPWCFGLWGLHEKIYTKSPKYFFFIKRLLNKFKDTNWKVSVIYLIDSQINFFGDFEKILKENFGQYRIRFATNNKKQYEFGEYSLIVQYNLENLDDKEVQVELLFNNMNVTYKNAKVRLQRLRILFNNVEKVFSLNKKNVQYSFDIKFSNLANPFYGVLIQRLGPEHIEYFECVLNPDVLTDRRIKNNDKKISVFKDSINICDSNFDNIEEIAKKCLLLED